MTPGDNTRRGWRARVTYCIKSHAYTEENTYTDPDGGRRCRECAREADRRRAA